MTVKDLFSVVSNGTNIKIVSSFNGKTRTTSKIKAKKFYDYEVFTVKTKIKTNNGKYDYGDWANSYLEISIRDFNDWIESEVEE